MQVSDETRARMPSDGTAGVSEERPDERPSLDWIEILQRFAGQTLASANGLLEVQADRVRLSLRRTVVKLVLASAAALCASLWLGAAALATLRGLCGGFAALWGGREWLGDLCGGVLALALAAGAVALHLQLSERRELIRLEAKYERIRNEPSPNDEHAVAPEDGGTTARARAGAGAPAHRRVGAQPG